MPTQHDEIAAWFAGRLPDSWFDGPATVESDNEEIWVVGPLRTSDSGADARTRRFREESRDERVRIAREAERRFRRRVAWGVEINGQRSMFTVRSTPVMTRLHLPQRRVLDTLVDAGVARSRSDALAWCVRLVGQHEGTWIKELREALQNVEEVRRQGPQ